MSTNRHFDADRRKIVKNLLAAGVGIYLVGCKTSKDGEEELELQPVEDVETVEEVEEILETNFVTFFAKGEEGFDELAEYFNLHTPRDPALIALPQNTEGVAQAMKYAKQNDYKVAVKSGGHSFEQFSSSDGGMVINMSLFKAMEWQSNDLRVEPGVLLRELYDEILPKRRILPAGSCGTVGVGGIALGGGYGFFARKYGLTCDHIISATMVDGNGEIHELGPQDDAMWAIKGGGNGNFGIITSFTFRTHPAPSHFANKRFKAYKLDPPRAKALMQTFFDNAQFLPQDCFAGFVLNGTTLTILLTHYDDESADGLQAFVDAFTPITDKQTEYDTPDIGKHLKNYYGAQSPLFFKNASAGYYNSFSDVEGCIDTVIEKVLENGLIYQVNTLGGKINSSEFATSGAYPHRSYEYLSELQCYWSKNQTTRRDNMLTAFEEIQTLFYENGNRAQYRNYPHIGFKNWESAYYGKNYGRLQDIKKKYDPEDRIQHDQSVKLA